MIGDNPQGNIPVVLHPVFFSRDFSYYRDNRLEYIRIVI